MEPAHKRRRLIPRQTTSVPHHERTALQQRAIQSEIRRAHRLRQNTAQAIARTLQPLQNEINQLVNQRNTDIVAFSRNRGAQRLAQKRAELQRKKEDASVRYIAPMTHWQYFWEDQYTGSQPPRPPPPPPAGLGNLNITNRAMS